MNLDADRPLERLFLPYQRDWILSEARKRLVEKSVRIGFTFADAFRNVRKRLRHRRRDYLFTTKDEATALEYVRLCRRFADFYDFGGAVLRQGIEWLRVPRCDAAGRDTGFVDEVRAGCLKFDNGSRILAFSSNPNALRAFGGDVGIDEFAFHPAAGELWAAAIGRIRWGYDLGVWSSHNGDDTVFHQFAQEARSGAGNWDYYRRLTILDALEQGLVERINAVMGMRKTRDEFLAECRADAGLPEVFEQEYLCQPRGGAASIVPWAALERCQRDYAIARRHWEDAQVQAAFGAFQPATAAAREGRIVAAVQQDFHPTFATPFKARLGFDVAASGAGDLAVIYVDEQKPDGLWLRALFTCRTEDWHFLKAVLFAFGRRLCAWRGCGDETGLGRQICWEAARAFPAQFTPVNFAREKHDLGFALMNQLGAAAKCFPRQEADVGADYFALRKSYRGRCWTFSEGRNALNPASHCDLAWAGALASRAAQQPPGPVAAVG